MDLIIKKAIEGGYIGDKHLEMSPLEVRNFIDSFIANKEKVLLDPLFWQALGKACGWENSERYWSVEQEVKITLLDSWENTAMTFHHKNLTEGWNQAVAYLQEVTK